MSEFSWVTLATNDSYSLGALVLAHSLKRVGTRYQLVVMVTPGVTQPMREKLAAVFDLVFEVNILDSKDERNLLLLQRPELGITFTKLHCWRLTQFKKCVFLDADTLVLQNCDELFEREEFSAAPDVGWPDCFNSGVFVYAPSNETFNSLLTFALERGSFDGGDQGLLNLYFSDWAHKDISKHLPFIYNMCSTACYSYLPAFKQFGENVKIVHFIGNSKPWLQYFNSENLQVTPTPGFNHLQLIFDYWWNLFCAHVHSNLATSMARIDSHIASSCTSSSHTFNHSINESKCEDSLCTEQSNAEINIPIWDPWENYTPIQIHDHDHLENKSNDNISVVVDNSNQTVFTVNSSHETKNEYSNNSNNREISVSIESKPIIHVANNSNLNSSQNSNYQNFSNNHDNHTNVENKTTSHVPPSTPYVSTPIHIESCSIPIVNYEVHSSQNACASCQTIKSATEQPNNTVTESGNSEKGTDQNGGLAGAFAQMTLREPKSASQGALEEHLRRQGWEAGRIDYLGQDSFDNVWKKICETLSAAPVKEPSPPKQLPVKQPLPPKEIVEQPIKQPSPPKEQPTKEPSPPKQVEVQPSAPAAVPESTPAPVESAPELACAVPPTPEAAPVAPISETPVTPTPVASTPEAQAASAPVAPASEAPVAPIQETPAPVASVTPTPETPTSVAPTPETPAPVAPVPETPIAPIPETPAPVAPTPETPVAAISETPVVPSPEVKAAPETVSPVEPTPVPDTTPIVAAEPAVAVAPSAESTTPVAVATEAVTEAPTAATPAPEAVPAAAPEQAAPAATPAPEPVSEAAPTAAPEPVSEAALTTAPEPVSEAPPAAAPEPVSAAPAATPAPIAEAPKPSETKAEEPKPKEAALAAVTEETKATSEVPQAAAVAAPPTITETPATPQTPDASKGDIKPKSAPAKSAEGQSSEMPVPPPRKSGKNGGATSKKSSKKK